MKNYLEGKIILITGGAGSIGSEIARSVLKYNPKVVRVLDINETGLFDLEERLQSEKLRPFVGDVRDKERLKRAMSGTDLVFHAAALKHVPLCEYNPFEAVKTNVVGSQNVLDTAIEERIERLINISTDKAVNPVNVMGATKLLSERLTVSANYYKGVRGKPVFSCVRFGNVFDTRGSVIPVFRNQIKNGGPITVTNPDMTRFIMSMPKAIKLLFEATKMAEGGEIFIFKMSALRIGDLAKAMCEELGPKYGYDSVKIEVVGKRAGEKLHEELMTGDEAEIAYEDEEMFIVLPQPQEIIGKIPYKLPDTFKKTKKISYSSGNVKGLTKDDIRAMVRESGVV
ncbi:SDR family NAD(P)-dependent oxidoreductase [Chloroflexota bacterium]